MLALVAYLASLQESPLPLSEGNEWVYRETWSDTWPRRTASDKTSYLEGLKTFAKEAAEGKKNPLYPTWPYLPPEGKDSVTFKITPKKELNISYEDGISIELRYEQEEGGMKLLSKTISVDGTVIVKNAIKDRETFLKLPLAKGDSWTYGAFEAKTEEEEEIAVPLGTFKCFRIVYVNKRPNRVGKCNIIGNPNSMTLWVSAGTGIVKQKWTTQWGLGGTEGLITQIRELIHFTKGPPGH